MVSEYIHIYEKTNNNSVVETVINTNLNDSFMVFSQ